MRYEGQLMQRKYQQFPVWTGHLVKTTRLLNHTNNGKDCHRYSSISSDCRNKMKACEPANILIYYLSFAAGISLKKLSYFRQLSYLVFICLGTDPNANYSLHLQSLLSLPIGKTTLSPLTCSMLKPFLKVGLWLKISW